MQATGRKRRTMSAAARARISAAMKQRWAKQKRTPAPKKARATLLRLGLESCRFGQVPATGLAAPKAFIFDRRDGDWLVLLQPSECFDKKGGGTKRRNSVRSCATIFGSCRECSCGELLYRFNDNSPDAMKTMEADIDQLLNALEPVKVGDQMVFTYVPGTGTTLAVNGRDKLTIPGAAFGPVLFSVWLGPKPPNADLKKGLLGQ